MKKVNKDSSKSFHHLSWQHAVAEYERMKKWSVSSNAAMKDIANRRIRELEEKYPSLAK